MARDAATAVRGDAAWKPGGINRMLQRHLNEARRADGELDLEAFIGLISRHYDALDEERAGVVRSMRVMSEEAQAMARGVLEESAARMQTILDNVKDAILTIDAAGRIETCNPMAERIFDYGAVEMLGRGLDFLLPEVGAGEVLRYLEGLAGRNGDAAHQAWCLARDGRRVAVELVVSRIRLGTGEGFIACLRDVTERQRAEQLVRESEARNRLLVELAPDAILVLDADRGRFVDVNDNACRLFRMSRERLLDCGIDDIVAPRAGGDGAADAIGAHLDAALVGSAPEFEWPFRASNGLVIPCEARFVRLPGAGQRLIRASITDISVRKRSEAIAAGERRVFEQIAANAPLATILESIALIIEEAAADGLCAIDVIEPGSGMLSSGAAPSLPREFVVAMDRVPVRPGYGSGAAAALLGSPLLTANIAADQAWTARREAAGYAGLRGAWATPLVAPDGAVIGAVTIYRRLGGAAAPADTDVIARLGHIACIAVERRRAEDALRESEARFRGLYENVLEGVYRSTLDGRFIAVNPACARILGYAGAEELRAVPCASLYAQPGQRESFVRRIVDEGEIRCEEIQLRRKDGSIVTVLDNSRAVRDAAGVVVGFEGTMIDVTERKRAETAMFEAKERAQVTLQSIGDAVITTDAQGLIDYLNPVAESLVGWEMRAALQRPIAEVLRLVDEDSGAAAECPAARCLREDRPLGLSRQTVLVTRHGQRIDIQHSAAPIHDRDGNLTGAVLVFHDISRERRLHRALHYQACHDALTGLINRREFESRLGAAVENVRQFEGAQHALLYLDLDQFKLVNDTCGHTAGDQLLRQLTGVLQAHIRGADTLARLGGDEFGILLHDVTVEQARTVAETLRASVRDYRFVWQGRVLSVGVSIGIVAITQHMASVSGVLSAADIACYSAKDGGRDRVRVYASEATPVQHRAAGWGSKLSRDCDQGAFELFYQPIEPLDPAAGDRERFQLLVHWRDESGALVAPDELLPAAERLNLAGAIDRWVVRKAVESLAHRAASQAAPYTLTIGLCGGSLNDDRFLEFLIAELTAHRLTPGALCFEIGETTAIANVGRVGHFMRELQACGCRFAIDDFGRGFSTLHCVRNLPIDYLKIDGTFIENVANDPVCRSLVQSIAGIGRALGVRTVAKRVGSSAQVAELGQLGIELAQGPHIAQPQPASLFPYRS